MTSKRILILFIALCISTLSKSQSLISLGIRGAYTTSKIETDIPAIVSKTMQGHQFGVFARLGKKWHIQPEVLLSAKGGKLEIELTGTNGKKLNAVQTIHLNTLEIPLLIGYSPVRSEHFNFRLQAGPSYNTVIHKDIYISSQEPDPPTQEELLQQIESEFYSLKVGAGVDIAFFTLDVRYEFGIDNIYNTNFKSAYKINSYQNSVFIMSLGIKLFSIL